MKPVKIYLYSVAFNLFKTSYFICNTILKVLIFDGINIRARFCRIFIPFLNYVNTFLFGPVNKFVKILYSGFIKWFKCPT